MNAMRFAWLAAGSPVPSETDGTPIKPRALTGRHCAACGESATYLMRDAISDNFTTVKNASRAWPFGGGAICEACVWCCKTLALRSGLWFATRKGIWFVASRPMPGMPSRRPDPLAAILEPPEPPFVAAYPLYGVDHGTEANCARIHWPGCPVPADPLRKCQSKHVAMYARISHSRDRYALQVDDVGDYTVDVPRWRALRAITEELLTEMRVGGVGSQDARASLLTLRLPPRCPPALARRWNAASAPLRPVCGAPWWALFSALIPMPELTERP